MSNNLTDPILFLTPEDGSRRRYLPDFLVRLSGGINLVLEIRDDYGPQIEAKRDALNEWVRALNSDGRFGCWKCEVALESGYVQDFIAIDPETLPPRAQGTSGARDAR